MRIIDVDELKKKLEAEHCDCEMMAMIDNMPTVDAEPVKHGYWIKTPSPYHFKCSSCKVTVWIKFLPVEDYKFCWHCGARMDGDTNG